MTYQHLLQTKLKPAPYSKPSSVGADYIIILMPVIPTVSETGCRNHEVYVG